MNAEQRRTELAKIIENNGGADVQYLADLFSVSPMTIRRDRKVLAERNMVQATHGGVLPLSFVYSEKNYVEKSTVNLKAKQAIAMKAAEMICDDSFILLDAGTTTLELARLLYPRRLTVITNDLHIALLLIQSPSIRVFMPAGEIDPAIGGIFGCEAIGCFANYNPSQAFIGSAAWHSAKGVTCSDSEKQLVKRAMMRCAENSILLVDSAKYGKYSQWNVSHLQKFSAVITDSGLSVTARAEVSAVTDGLCIADC